MPPIIEVIEARKSYRVGKVDVPALRGVSFTVEPGEFIAILGPSGSGKSTLFYLLGGLTRATEGKVVIDGADFSTLSDAERTRLRKSKIGFVFQKFNLLPTLDAKTNIEIAMDISGKKIDQPYFDRITDLLGISKRLTHRTSELSGGEQQRVALARELINQPAIILTDEPTGNLDTGYYVAMLNFIQHSNKQLAKTILIITHNPAATEFADRSIHKRDGRIVGPTNELHLHALQTQKK